MSGGNLYRSVSFQSFGYIHFSCLFLISFLYIHQARRWMRWAASPSSCGRYAVIPRAEPGQAEHRALRPGRMPLMKVAPCDRRLSMG